jgi:hypothetical protein
MHLFTEFPVWYWLLCLLAGIVYASTVYLYRKKPSFNKALTILLFTLRTTGVAMTAFLLLSPMVMKQHRQIKKPAVILAVDNSESVGQNPDEFGISAESLTSLTTSLKDKYHVIPLTFGDTIGKTIDSLRFDAKASDMSLLIKHLNENYRQENLQSVVIFSDGIINRGENPLYADWQPGVTLHTVMLGNARPGIDLRILKVSANREIYSGNEFQVEILGMGQLAKGAKTTLSIFHQDTLIKTLPLYLDARQTSFKKHFFLKAKGKGIQTYHVRIEPLQDEENTRNNQQTFYVEVVSEPKKVLILAAAPHPDLFALKSALHSQKQYQVTTRLISSKQHDFQDYDLIVLHQLPIAHQSEQFVNQIINLSKPKLWITGLSSDLAALDRHYQIFSFQPTGKHTEEALPLWNPEFSLFNVSEVVPELLSFVGPLQTPMGIFKQPSGNQVALYQQIGSVKTTNPLLYFVNTDKNRTGFLLGTGIWRWRMVAYMKHESHKQFDDFVTAMAQYLTTEKDKRLFRVTHKNRYFENEPVDLEAILFNPSYEKINIPDVKIDISNGKKEIYAFLFDKKDGIYHLNAGLFPPGNYSFEAQTTWNDTTYRDRGKFIIAPYALESRNLVANHDLLKQLAKKHQGIAIKPKDLSRLQDSLLKKNVKPMQTQSRHFSPIIRQPWWLILILFIFTIEWFIRKYNGTY